ncbi:F-box only protein 9 [Eupeodes corollae]|uniref:F-box only protein 9 n=1 Tax=Eupeodes corollae TaxID=290404 RepID=UPI0024909D24|nr:F-box only protein 9 [Eupeodes corollae]
MQSGNKSDGDEEAEAESSSSSSSEPTTTTATRMDNMANEFRSVLDEFRENWQKELKPEDKPTTNKKNSSLNQSLSLDNNTSPEIQAQTLFKHAVDLEQRGKVYDALQYYRRAVQLDPDIEFKAYEASKIPQQVENEANNNNVLSSVRKVDAQPDEESEEPMEEDLFIRFQNDIAKQGRLIMSNRDTGVISTEMHISDLPTEILLYILRWVVSTQLDMKSLEQCAAVCKGIYLCARDEEIWRQACLKVWGVNLGCITGTPYDSWRQMFIERERIHFNGCYISKTTYLRLGENSFQDQFYRPVQLVEYYRYVRFMPDGTVLMMTSSDEPAQGVTRLKNLNQLRSEVLRGHYRLHGDTVTLMLKKNQRLPKGEHYYGGGGKRRGSVAQGNDIDANFTTYYIEFNIASTPKKRFSQLQWKNYSIILVRNKREVSSDFELTPSKYPPLRFSCVRSYHLDAEAPLQ